jgi:hypothetical protein
LFLDQHIEGVRIHRQIKLCSLIYDVTSWPLSVNFSSAQISSATWNIKYLVEVGYNPKSHSRPNSVVSRTSNTVPNYQC